MSVGLALNIPNATRAFKIFCAIHGVKLAELARQVGVTVTVFHPRHGLPSISPRVIVAACKALGVPTRLFMALAADTESVRCMPKQKQKQFGLDLINLLQQEPPEWATEYAQDRRARLVVSARAAAEKRWKGHSDEALELLMGELVSKDEQRQPTKGANNGTERAED